MGNFPVLDGGYRTDIGMGIYIQNGCVHMDQAEQKERRHLYGYGILHPFKRRVLLIGNERKGFGTQISQRIVGGDFAYRKTQSKAGRGEKADRRAVRGHPVIELFARQQASGWDCWGNEV